MSPPPSNVARARIRSRRSFRQKLGLVLAMQVLSKSLVGTCSRWAGLLICVGISALWLFSLFQWRYQVFYTKAKGEKIISCWSLGNGLLVLSRIPDFKACGHEFDVLPRCAASMVNYGLIKPRCFGWSRTDLGPLGHLLVPLWLPLMIASVPTIFLWAKRPRKRPGFCGRCGYNLTGNVSGRCPECGTLRPQ